MAKEEIVEGIRIALEKGQTMKDAMMSFFNAGYPREDINDAAREVLGMRDTYGNRMYSNEGKIGSFKNSSGEAPLAPNMNVPRQNIFNNPSPRNPFQQPVNQFQQQNQTQFGQNYPQQQNQLPIQNPKNMVAQNSQNFSNNQNNLNLPSPTPPTVNQKVSDYSSEKKSSRGKGVLFFFLFLLLLLITGAIVGLVFFKAEIFSFLGI